MDDEGVLDVSVDHDQADDGILTARLIGEIDPGTAPALLAEIQALLFTSSPRELVLDLAGVTFMDSSGTRVLINLHREQRDRDAHLILMNVPAVPRRVLEISGLTSHLEFR